MANESEDVDEDEAHSSHYDIIIVGGGTSAMGLLLGLLNYIIKCRENQTHDDMTPPFQFTIAVIERGNCDRYCSRQDYGDRQSSKNITDNNNDIGGRCKNSNGIVGDDYDNNKNIISNWYKVSHDTSSSYNQAYTSFSSNMKRRVSMPTGMSLGGSTNINACLLMKPSIDDFDSCPYCCTSQSNRKNNTDSSLASSSSLCCNCWPGIWNNNGNNSTDSRSSDSNSTTKKYESLLLSSCDKIIDYMMMTHDEESDGDKQEGGNTGSDSCIQVVNMCNVYKEMCYSPSSEVEQNKTTGQRKGISREELIKIINQTNTFTSDGNFLSSIPLAAVATTRNTVKTTSSACSTTSTNAIRRMNYFDILIKPLLDKHPFLLEEKIINFFSNTQAEYIVTTRNVNRDDYRATGVRCRKLRHGNKGISSFTSSYNSSDTANKGDVEDEFTIYCRSNRKKKSSRTDNISDNANGHCGEIILCCGSILTPALLLVSGIGNPSDLQKANIKPYDFDDNSGSDDNTHNDVDEQNNVWSKNKPNDNICNKINNVQNQVSIIPVGCNLRDHILVPRIFLCYNKLRPLLLRPWIIFSKASRIKKSANTIQSLYNVDIPIQSSHQKQERHQQRLLSSSSSSSSLSSSYRIQIQFFDGTILSHFLPNFLTSFISLEQKGRRKNSALKMIMVLYYILHRILVFICCYTPIYYILSNCIVGVNICLLNPKSVGKISVIRRNQQTRGDKQDQQLNIRRDGLSKFHLIINNGYLSDERDVHALKLGFNLIENQLRINNDNGITNDKQKCYSASPTHPSSFFGYWFNDNKKYGFFELAPGLLFRTIFQLYDKYYTPSLKSSTENTSLLSKNDEWFRQYTSMFACPYFHWCGTCTMGSTSNGSDVTDKNNGAVEDLKNQKNVVNDQLHVACGLKGLRICDASVFPKCVSNPTALTCAALGYGLSTLIIKDFVTRKMKKQQ